LTKVIGSGKKAKKLRRGGSKMKEARIMVASDGKVYDVYEVTKDYIYGYLSFPSYGQPNPRRKFPVDEVRMHTIRKLT
jgi:hypothetical protein